jgi:hypothetical protein
MARQTDGSLYDLPEKIVLIFSLAGIRRSLRKGYSRDEIKIKKIVEGFEQDEGPMPLYDRCLMVWEIVRPYKEES